MVRLDIRKWLYFRRQDVRDSKMGWERGDNQTVKKEKVAPGFTMVLWLKTGVQEATLPVFKIQIYFSWSLVGMREGKGGGKEVRRRSGCLHREWYNSTDSL